MKKIVLFMALIATCALVSAQPRAVGLRLGYGVEATYQHQLGASNMVSLDAGMYGTRGFEAACTYDWINPGGLDFSKVWSNKGTWNWFAGVGAALGFDWPKMGSTTEGSYHAYAGFAGATGRVGVEYNFWFPLQLSLDWRPTFGVYYHDYYHSDMGYDKGCSFYTQGLYASAIALSVRYKF